MMIRATLVLVLALELATAQFSGFSDEFDSDFSYYKWDPMPSAQRSDSAVFITGTGVSLGLTQAFNLNTAGTDAINVTLSWTPNVLIPMDEDVMIAVWCERDLVFAFPSPLYLLLIVTRRYPPPRHPQHDRPRDDVARDMGERDSAVRQLRHRIPR